MTWKPKQLTIAQLEERRIAGVAMLTDKENKKSQNEVAQIMGVSRIAVYKWFKRAKEEALQAVAKSGRPCRLNAAQLEQLSQMIQDSPSKYGYDSLGWTTKMVADLIQQQFKVSYNPDHVGVIMHKIGMSVQKPKKRGIRRDQLKIDTWAKEEFPALKKMAEFRLSNHV
jgi:transposase